MKLSVEMINENGIDNEGDIYESKNGKRETFKLINDSNDKQCNNYHKEQLKMNTVQWKLKNV